MSSPESPQVVLYEFGRFRIDTSNRILRSGSEALLLPPKAVDTLIYLLERPEAVVTRTALMAAIWPDVFIEENNLTQYISLLRKTLRDDSREANFIQTIARRGYRFCCPVARSLVSASAHQIDSEVFPANIVAPPEPPPSSQRQAPLLHRHPTRGRNFSWAIIAMALCIVAIYGLMQHVRRPPIVNASATVSIAVLPAKTVFDWDSGNASGLALADNVIRYLHTRRTSARVFPISAVRKFAMKSIYPVQAGRQLDADFVLALNLESRPDHQVQLEATLFRSSDGVAVWSDKAKGDADKIIGLELQQVTRLETALWSGIESNVAAPQPITRNLKAYAFYERGQAQLDLRTSEGIYKGIESLQQAVATDTSFAEGFAALAAGQAYDIQEWKKAAANADRALMLNPQLADAHAVLGLVHLLWLDDCPGAAAELRKSLALDPTNAFAHLWYAAVFAQLGRNVEAVEEARIAHDLDPWSQVIATGQARMSYLSGNFELAHDQCLKAIAIDPSYLDAHSLMFSIEIVRHQYDNAMVEFRLAETLAAGSGPYNISVAKTLDLAYHTGGIKAFWEARLNFLTHYFNDEYEVARELAYLGKNQQAIDHLSVAMQQRHEGLVPYLFALSEPTFFGMHTSRRFQQITYNPGT